MAQTLPGNSIIGQAGAGMLSGIFVCYLCALLLDKFTRVGKEAKALQIV